jgi:membrane-bound ClpP family serine protease
MTLLYAILLLVAFYLLLTAEFFLPSGGFLGVAAFAALIASVVIAFSQSTTAGFLVLGIALTTTPLMIFGLLKIWPHTPIGRRMLNRRPGETAARPSVRTTSSGTPLDQLVGRIGTAKTDLLPSGMIAVDSDKVDAVSLGMAIDQGQKVIVTSVEAGKVHVRPATDQDVDPTATPSQPQSPPALEDNLESFDFE